MPFSDSLKPEIMLVKDYKYTESVKISGDEDANELKEPEVCHLRLLIDDERMNEEGEATWVNARLAGQLWPGAVIDFYLDHLVINHVTEEEDGAMADNETALMRYLLYLGLFLWKLGYKVEEVVGTISISRAEWRLSFIEKQETDVDSIATLLRDQFLDADDEDGNDPLEDPISLLTDAMEDVQIKMEAADIETEIARYEDLDDTISVHEDDQDDSDDGEDDDLAVLLVQVTLSHPDKSKQYDVLLHLEQLKEEAPRKLLDYLESKLSFTSEAEDENQDDDK